VAQRVAAHRQASAAAPVFAQHGDEEEAQQIHQAVPVHLHRADMEGDRIELGDKRLRHAEGADRAKAKCSVTQGFGKMPRAQARSPLAGDALVSDQGPAKTSPASGLLRVPVWPRDTPARVHSNTGRSGSSSGLALSWAGKCCSSRAWVAAMPPRLPSRHSPFA